MYIYLVQHGKAHSKSDDPERGLTEEGKAEVRLVAELVKGKNPGLNSITHSGRNRARETAEILAEEFDCEQVIQSEGFAPNDDAVAFSGKIPNEGSFMYVGHLPFMEKFASFLMCGDEKVKLVDFKNGGIVCLSNEGNDRFAVQWAVTP